MVRCLSKGNKSWGWKIIVRPHFGFKGSSYILWTKDLVGIIQCDETIEEKADCRLQSMLLNAYKNLGNFVYLCLHQFLPGTRNFHFCRESWHYSTLGSVLWRRLFFFFSIISVSGCRRLKRPSHENFNFFFVKTRSVLFEQALMLEKIYFIYSTLISQGLCYLLCHDLEFSSISLNSLAVVWYDFSRAAWELQTAF